MRMFPFAARLAAAFCVAGFAAHPALAQSLEATIANALAFAPQHEGARAAEDAARARLDRARAERNPSLTVEGMASTGRIDNGGFFGITAANVTPRAAQAVIELPLYAGGRVGAAIDQARGGARLATHAAEQVRLQTIVAAVAAHAEVLAARQLEASHERLSAQLAEVERQAGLRFRAGEIPKSDLAHAEARRAEADAGLAQAIGRRVSAEDRYGQLTGEAPAALAPLPPAPHTPPTLADALEQARRDSPLLKQAEEGVGVAQATVRAAGAEGRPTIGAFAEAAHVRDQFFPDYRADSVAVGVRGRWTLFAGGRVATQQRAARADLARSRAQQRDAMLAVDGAVTDAWQGLLTARRMQEASTRRRAAAVEALRATRLEAQVGAKPVLAVLDAEREAIAAEAAFIEAGGRQLVAAWQLNALAGTACSTGCQ